MNNINSIKSNSYDMLSFILGVKKNTIKQFFSKYGKNIMDRNNIKEYIERIQFDIPGVYCIENTLNGKKYVGQSGNIKDRLKLHFNSLKTGKHPIIELQNDYNTWGKNIFISYVLRYINDKNNRLIYEKEIISKININLIYNDISGSIIGLFNKNNYNFLKFCLENEDEIKSHFGYK